MVLAGGCLSRKEWHAQKRYAQLINYTFNQKDDLIKSLNLKLEKAKNILAKVLHSIKKYPGSYKQNRMKSKYKQRYM